MREGVQGGLMHVNRDKCLRYAAVICSLIFQASPIKAQAKADGTPAGALFRLGDSRWRHATAVYFVAVMPGNERILTASRDHVIRLWDIKTGTAIRQFQSSTASKPFLPHPPKFYRGSTEGDNGNSKVAVSADGKRIAAVLPNQVLQMWDAETGKEIWSVQKCPFAREICFSPNGKTVAVRDTGQPATLYDTENGRELALRNDPKDGDVHPGGTAGMAFSPDSIFLANGRLGYKEDDHTYFVAFFNASREIG